MRSAKYLLPRHWQMPESPQSRPAGRDRPDPASCQRPAAGRAALKAGPPIHSGTLTAPRRSAALRKQLVRAHYCSRAMENVPPATYCSSSGASGPDNSADCPHQQRRCRTSPNLPDRRVTGSPHVIISAVEYSPCVGDAASEMASARCQLMTADMAAGAGAGAGRLALGGGDPPRQTRSPLLIDSEHIPDQR